MVIEWQRVRMRPDLRQRFLERDEEVWTAGLAREPGFLGKEVWLGEDPGEVVLVIRWRSEEDWKGVAAGRLAELESRFRNGLPEGHEIVELKTFIPVRSA